MSPQETIEDAAATGAALRASESRYRRLFETAQDGILILDGDSGRIVDANPFIAQISGYSHQDFVGKELWQIGVFEDIAASKAAFDELQEKGYIRYADLPLRTAAGGEIAVEFISNVYQVNGQRVIQCNIREITQRKKVEAALSASARLNRYLIEHLPHRIVVKDRNSVMLFCNANYAGDIGCTPDEVVGKDAFAFHPPGLAEAYHADDKEVMDRGVMKDVEERYQAAGGERWVHTVKVPYRDEAGEVTGVLVAFEDITDRKRLEEQVRQSQKLEGIGLLAGGVAHDFNNLLTVILGYCELIAGRLAKDDPLAGDVEQIRKCGERAATLTSQLLAFSRKQVLDVRVIDLNTLVSDLGRMLQRLIGDHIDLRTVLAAESGCVRADRGQVEQVLMNLVVNARDAMPQGGKLILETSNVDIDAYAGNQLDLSPGSYVLLAVTDTGCGFDAATKARIFEPFFTTKEQGKGTGLGLSTVYGIVTQSGGNIRCYSEPDRGSTFTVYLPRVTDQLAPPESSPGQVAALERPAPALGGAETVLVAEDEDMLRELIEEMLTSAGYQVIATSNGGDALRAAESSSAPIDLLITDVVMPGMSGNELSQRIEQIRPGVKVLFMSGYTGDAMLHQGVPEGTAFLHKPFTPDSLNRKVREVLDRQ